MIFIAITFGLIVTEDLNKLMQTQTEMKCGHSKFKTFSHLISILM